VDASHPDAARTQWLDATAGDLHEQLKRTGTRKDTGTASARATVTDAALTALDNRAGTAELIATVRVETTPGDGEPTGTDRKRLEATLARTGDGWKVTALTAVPVAGS
jgi:Mce-associated membrane protein